MFEIVATGVSLVMAFWKDSVIVKVVAFEDSEKNLYRVIIYKFAWILHETFLLLW